MESSTPIVGTVDDHAAARPRPDHRPNTPTGRRVSPSVSRARIELWAALGLVYVVWGSTYLGIKVAVRTLPPFLTAGTRFLAAAAVLAAILAVARRSLRVDRRDWRGEVGGEEAPITEEVAAIHEQPLLDDHPTQTQPVDLPHDRVVQIDRSEALNLCTLGGTPDVDRE